MQISLDTEIKILGLGMIILAILAVILSVPFQIIFLPLLILGIGILLKNNVIRIITIFYSFLVSALFLLQVGFFAVVGFWAPKTPEGNNKNILPAIIFMSVIGILFIYVARLLGKENIKSQFHKK